MQNSPTGHKIDTKHRNGIQQYIKSGPGGVYLRKKHDYLNIHYQSEEFTIPTDKTRKSYDHLSR